MRDEVVGVGGAEDDDFRCSLVRAGLSPHKEIVEVRDQLSGEQVDGRVVDEDTGHVAVLIEDQCAVLRSRTSNRCSVALVEFIVTSCKRVLTTGGLAESGTEERDCRRQKREKSLRLHPENLRGDRSKIASLDRDED